MTLDLIQSTTPSIQHTPSYKSSVAEKASEKSVPVGVTIAPAAEADESTASSHGPVTNTHRGLTSRHIALLSIGGVIGTGLFIGTGQALSQGGPFSLLLGYSLFSGIVWCVTQSIAVPITRHPVNGAFITLFSRWIDPALGFALGWNYLLGTTSFVCAEVSAIASLFAFWAPDVNNAVWCTITLVVIFVLNAWAVRWWGEAEFYFASFKVLLILGLLLMSFFFMVGANPDRDVIGFRYWKNPGPMAEYNHTGAVGRFEGFYSIFIFAAFAIGGPEFVAFSAPEAQDVRRTIPKAMRRVPIRLIAFYVLGAFAVGVLVPYNDPKLLAAIENGVGVEASPFVLAMQRYGINWLPHLVNLIVLTSAWSCGNSFAYVSIRNLHGLAKAGHAPQIFSRTTRRGVPLYALLFVLAVGCLGYLTSSSNSIVVFNWFVNICSASGFLNYGTICLLYLRFRAGCRAQGISTDDIQYKERFQPYAAWIGLTGAFMLLLTNGYTVFVTDNWNTQTFICSYFCIALVVVLYIGFKIAKRTTLVRASTMDLVTGKQEADDDEAYWNERRVVPVARWEKFLEWLF